MGFVWSVGAHQWQGRRPNQEDRCTAGHEGCTPLPLLVLTDGMGGHSAGEKASFWVINAFFEAFDEKNAQDDEGTRRELQKAAKYASDVLRSAKEGRCSKDRYELSNEDHLQKISDSPPGKDAGCTLIAAYINKDTRKVYFLSVGDSLILMKKRGGKLKWVNWHVLDTRLSDLMRLATDAEKRFGKDSDEYRTAREKIFSDPKRHGLTQAVTGHRDPVSHLLGPYELEEGDRFILASDGLAPLLPGDESTYGGDFGGSELENVLEKHHVPYDGLTREECFRISRRSATEIINAVKNKNCPSQDNVSVILVDVPSSDVPFRDERLPIDSESTALNDAGGESPPPPRKGAKGSVVTVVLMVILVIETLMFCKECLLVEEQPKVEGQRKVEGVNEQDSEIELRSETGVSPELSEGSNGGPRNKVIDERAFAKSQSPELSGGSNGGPRNKVIDERAFAKSQSPESSEESTYVPKTGEMSRGAVAGDSGIGLATDVEMKQTEGGNSVVEVNSEKVGRNSSGWFVNEETENGSKEGKGEKAQTWGEGEGQNENEENGVQVNRQDEGQSTQNQGEETPPEQQSQPQNTSSGSANITPPLAEKEQRTVVSEKIKKWDGSDQILLTGGEVLLITNPELIDEVFEKANRAENHLPDHIAGALSRRRRELTTASQQSSSTTEPPQQEE